MCRHDYLTITTDMEGDRCFTICLNCDRLFEVINDDYFSVAYKDEIGIINGLKNTIEYKLEMMGL